MMDGMKSGLLPLFLLVKSAAFGAIIPDVRTAIARNDFDAAGRHLQQYRASNGVTSEFLEALSWMGRGSLAANLLDKAEEFAAETHQLSLEQLKRRPLDAENHLPIALGAAIEVKAQVLAKRNQLSESIAFLNRELETYRATSIRTRIQKNINLLTLEGKTAPALDLSEYIGPKPRPLRELVGKPLILFFWAHWCGSCKRQTPVLARLQEDFGKDGLVIVGPSQRYGYAVRGEDATPDEERAHIETVRKQQYGELAEMTVPLSAENFLNYGASTTPTLVLVDRQGIVRLYHPGTMPYDQLAPKVQAIVRPRAAVAAGE
jgi:thiol-disulfide isomerase/thioredoxin